MEALVPWVAKERSCEWPVLAAEQGWLLWQGQELCLQLFPGQTPPMTPTGCCLSVALCSNILKKLHSNAICSVFNAMFSSSPCCCSRWYLTIEESFLSTPVDALGDVYSPHCSSVHPSRCFGRCLWSSLLFAKGQFERLELHLVQGDRWGWLRSNMRELV